MSLILAKTNYLHLPLSICLIKQVVIIFIAKWCSSYQYVDNSCIMEQNDGFQYDEKLSNYFFADNISGRTFDSLDTAWEFYKAYGYHKGFSVRRSTKRYGKCGGTMSQEFCCAGEGMRNYKTQCQLAISLA